MTTDERKKLKRLVKRYAQAAVQNSWKGNMEPAECKKAEQNYKQAQRNLYSFIKSM